MRGRLFIAGISGDTPITDALDVLTVIVMDTPGEALRRWRDGIDRAALAAQITPRPARHDRDTWGLRPDQIAATQRFMSNWGVRG